jgi:ketosteroid isomerase-like protein
MPNLNRGMMLLGAAALALSMSGCAKYEHREGHEEKADTAAIADAIKADEKKWSDEFQAQPRSLDQLVSHYADDANFVMAGAKARGMNDIRKLYAEGLKDPNFNLSFAADKVEVAESGDLAVSTGKFTETGTDPATKQAKTQAGSFVTVYKKQADGSWKAIQDWAIADPVPALPK